MTKVELVLQAAAALHAAGHATFARNALVVAAWEASPGAFGLAGYETQFPDTNAVVAKLSGARGLIDDGFLERVGEGCLRLTAKGRAKLAAAAS